MPQAQYRDPTLLQVLSLYLLLLAFFVLLFNLSRAEQLKSDSVAHSLKTTFSDKGHPNKKPKIFVSAEGKVLEASRESFQKLGLLVQTIIPIAEFKVIEVGRVFRARFPVSELFDSGEARPRAERADRVRRIADALSKPPGGVWYNVEVKFTGSRKQTEKSALAYALAISRAGHFARMALEMGVPSGAIATGVAAGQAERMEMLFHMRSREETQLSLDPAVAGTPR